MQLINATIPYTRSLPLGTHLKSTHDTARVHAGGHIHRITPNVVLGLLRANNSGNHWAVIETDPQSEPLE